MDDVRDRLTAANLGANPRREVARIARCIRAGAIAVLGIGAITASGAVPADGDPVFFDSGFERPCDAEVNTPPGYVGGGGSGQPASCAWSASGSVATSATSPVISTVAPDSGDQHLRFQYDPGQATGHVNLDADPNSRNWAFSANIVPAPAPGIVTLSFEIRISNPDMLNAVIIQPQTPTQGTLTTVMVFNPGGTLNVGDDNGDCDDPFISTFPTGTTWTAGEYVSAAICVDTINDRIRYFYDDEFVYSTGAGEGGTGGPLGCGVFSGTIIEHVLIRLEGNFDDGTIVDIDDVRIEAGGCAGVACAEDLQSDGQINFVDILAVIAQWGPCGAVCEADLNGNGHVDFADILAVISAWGPCE